ncbi:uncharacterized protein BDV17DRAFT_296119 [Aspergillus undulatus]|uniref:uncharacterized protein n=1 Tax=Aspergillus undulatus TaxID=1810928 RepID=UPI003CCD1881
MANQNSQAPSDQQRPDDTGNISLAREPRGPSDWDGTFQSLDSMLDLNFADPDLNLHMMPPIPSDNLSNGNPAYFDRLFDQVMRDADNAQGAQNPLVPAPINHSQLTQDTNYTYSGFSHPLPPGPPVVFPPAPGPQIPNPLESPQNIPVQALTASHGLANSAINTAQHLGPDYSPTAPGPVRTNPSHGAQQRGHPYRSPYHQVAGRALLQQRASHGGPRPIPQPQRRPVRGEPYSVLEWELLTEIGHVRREVRDLRVGFVQDLASIQNQINALSQMLHQEREALANT